MRHLFLLFSCVCLLGLQMGSAETPASPASNPAALALLTRTVSAITAGNRLDDVELKGTAEWHAGSENLRGPVTLQASSSGRSKLQLDFGPKSLTEFSSGDNDEPGCTLTEADNVAHEISVHNCWTLGAWFFPALSMMPAQQRGNVVVSYVGRETSNQVPVEHLRLQKVFLGRSSNVLTLLNHLNSADLYVDGSTMLPTTLKYFVHPENDARVDIPVEIRFSDYRDAGGIKVPFHIEKLINGASLLDLQVNSAVFNTGVLAK